MSAMRKIKVTEPLIERLLGEVRAEIDRRSDLTGKVANIVDPFQIPRERNTSRGAIFNLAGSSRRLASFF